jgi:hypothetical protein
MALFLRPAVALFFVLLPLSVAAQNPPTPAAKDEPGKDVPVADQRALLVSARSQIYNLRSAGLKSYHCDIDFDWNAFFVSAGGKAVPADDPMSVYLNGLRFAITNDLDTPKVESSATGTPPAGREEPALKIKGSVEGVLNGYLAAWSPFLRGFELPDKPTTFTLTSAGYAVTNKEDDSLSEYDFDKDMHLTHVATRSSALVVEMDTAFKTLPQGKALTQLDSVYRQPATAPPTHLLMTSAYGPVNGLQIPIDLKVEIPNVAIYQMKFTGCTVTK